MQSSQLSRKRVVRPVRASTRGVQVLDGADQVLPHPGVVHIPDPVLGTNLANRGGDVRVPCRRHAREEVVFDLEVEPTGETARHESAVSARRFDLRGEPAHGFARFAHRLGRIAVRIDKVVREAEQDRQSEAVGDAQEQHVTERPKAQAVVQKRADHVDPNVQDPQHDGVLAAALDEVALHLHPHELRPALLEIEDLRIEHRRQPVPRQHWHVVQELQGVVPLAGRVPEWVIVEEQHRLGPEGVRVLGGVIGVGVVRPVLFLPQPLAPADEVGTQSQQVVDPWTFAAGAVIGVVLDVHPDEGLRKPVHDGQLPRRSARDPQVLQVEKGHNVARGAEEVPQGPELAAAADNLEDLLLDFSFEWGVELVPAKKVAREGVEETTWTLCVRERERVREKESEFARKGAMTQDRIRGRGATRTRPQHVLASEVGHLAHQSHLLQVLRGVVRVDHVVLDRHVISPKQLDLIAAGVIEVGDVVNKSIDAHFGGLKRRQ